MSLDTQTSGTQARPAIAAGPNEFLAVWRDEAKLVGRRLAATGGPIGEEIRIDADDDRVDEEPVVTAVGDGYVVLWRQDDPDDDEPPAIVGRRLDSTGAALGDEFRIDAPRDLPLASYYLSGPNLAVAGNLFVAVWASGTYNDVYDFYETDAFSRTFHADGTPSGEARLLGGGIGDEALEPDIGALSSGFVVAWRSGSTLWMEGYLRGRKLTAGGGPIGTTLYFATVDQPNDQPIVIARAEDVQLLWTMRDDPYDDADDLAGLRARRFDIEGLPLTDELALNAVATPQEREPGRRTIAAERVGADTVVAWIAGDGPSEDGDTGLWAQVVDADGRARTPLRRVNEAIAGAIPHLSVAVLGSTALAVVWSRDGDVFARVLAIAEAECGDADGNGSATSADALVALRAAVGSSPCAPCICDADGSGTHSTSDALAVLREAVGLPAALDCPVCTEGSGTPFDLLPDEGCFGSRIEVPRDALPADLDLVTCTLDRSLVPRSCDASLVVNEDGLVFDARDCWLPDAVFTCVMPEQAEDGFVQSATVRCGCRCAECAGTPRLCRRGSDACSPAPVAASHVLEPPRVANRVTKTVTEAPPIATTTSTSTSFCGTCCNLEELGQLEAASAQVVTELKVRVKSDDTTDCTFCYRDFAGYTGEVSAEGEGDTTIICLVDHQGFPASGVLAGCEGYGFFEKGPAEVLHARGANFEPVDPLPSVVVAPVTPP